ncbi:response regulator [bacterium]|nr:response regulator [bacterium]
MSKNKKVLIVEDDINIRNVISMYLKKEGFWIFETDNGIEALSIIEKEKPDLIILDLIIPGLSGYEVYKQIKSNKETKNITIVILSAADKEHERLGNFYSGADLYETKPFSPKNLIKNVKAIFN